MAKKAPTKKATAKKATAKKATAKKATAKKATAKKATAKKATAKKATAKKATAKKATAKKATAKKATAKKATAKKATAKKATAKKATAKKATAKKATAKKATAKKATAKKVASQKPLVDREAKALSPLDRRLIAGGLLPLDQEAQVNESRRVDRVSARSYRHPALGGPVVRLVPDPIAEGEDVALAVLGFSPPEVQGPLALRARRSLGFPAWALANDPQRARHALDLLKEFRQIAKRARTKPGDARERFTTLSRQLGRSVPHFLPTFLEEAGRVFLVEGNRAYAAQFFGAARESERTHGLQLDLDRLQTVALEFALAGALTVKALTTYAEELASRADPDVAYRHFRELCVRRSRGGLPPWPSVLADLRRLAKAADRDAAAEEAEFIKTLLRSGSGVEGAAKGFWTKALKPITRLAAEEPEVLGILLDVFPRFESEERTDWWLDRLQGWGALDALESGRRSPATWFNRVLTWNTGWNLKRSRRLLGVLRRLAPALQAEGAPLKFAGGSGWRGEDIDADLLDLALELGVPVAEPRSEEGQPRGQISLSAWAEVADDERAERPRPLDALCADERFRGLLLSAVGAASGERAFDQAASKSPGLTRIRRAWIERIVERFQSGGLPDAAGALATLKAQAKARVYADLPEAVARLQGLELGPILGRSLRAGSLDELGWPELEDLLAAAEAAKQKVQLSGHFPYLIVSEGTRATVLGPGGKHLEHELRVPAGAELSELLYVGDQLRVGYRTKDYDWKAYWSRDPKTVFEGSYAYRHFTPAGPVARLEDGATSWGGPALTPGETRASSSSHHARFVHDGQSWWIRSWREQGWSLRELAPRSGKEGRWSLPAWLEDFGGQGWSVEADDSWLLPADFEGLAAIPSESPLGAGGGWIGWRVRKRKDPGAPTVWESEAPDGRRFCGRLRSLDLDVLPLGLLSLPGLEEPLPLSEEEGLTLWSPEGTWRAWQAREASRYETPDVPTELPWGMPPVWLSLLRPRQPEASLALRGLSDAAAGRLLRAAQADRAARPPKAKPTLPEAQLGQALERELPELTHPQLRRALADLVDWAASLATSLERYAARAAEGPSVESEPPRPALGDEEVEAGAKGLLRAAPGYCWRGSAERQWHTAARFFASGELTALEPEDEDEDDLEEQPDLERPPPLAPPSSHRWEDLLGLEASVAYRAASPGFGPEERAQALSLLRTLAASPWVGAGESYRRCSFSWDRAPDLGFDWLPLSWGNGHAPHNVLTRHEGNAYLIRFDSWDPSDGDQATVVTLEDKSSGEFKDLPGAASLTAEVVSPGLSAAELRLLADTLEARGPWPPDPEALERLSPIGLGRGQAAMLLLGFPGLGSWEQNFLPKDTRTALKLKVAEAAKGKEALGDLEPGQRGRVLAHAAREVLLPACAGEAWPEDLAASLATSLAEGWVAACGDQVAIPEEALQLMDRLKTHLDERELLTAVLDSPARAKLLADRGRVDLGGLAEESAEQIERVLGASLRMLSLFHQELPAGDPLLAPLAEFGRDVLALLEDPSLILPTGHPFHERYGVDAKELEAFLAEIGGEVFSPQDGASGRDEGVVIALQTGRSWSPITTAFRVAAFRATGGEHPLLRKLNSLEPRHRRPLCGLRLVERLQSPGPRALVERLAESPVARGSYEADPRASAPALVAAARAAHDLSEEGATLYLQLLTLAAPTDRNLRRFNGWSAAVLKRATAELASKELVVLAKRSRAGRGAFLPGGWERFASPDLPLETWKLKHYEARLDAEGRWERPLETLLPPRPLHELFVLAWERAQGDDPPRYEEVK